MFLVWMRVGSEIDIRVRSPQRLPDITKSRAVHSKSKGADNAQDCTGSIVGPGDSVQSVLVFMANFLILTTHPNGATWHDGLPSQFLDLEVRGRDAK